MAIPALALAAMISGGATIAGGAIGASGARSAARRASQEAALDRQFQAEQAQLDRQFQRNLSNTAYRRAARDLEKAGLNRILALGSPASSPGGRGVSGSSAAAPVAQALTAAGQVTAAAAGDAVRNTGDSLQAISQSKLNAAKSAQIMASIDWEKFRGKVGEKALEGVDPLIEGLRSSGKATAELESNLIQELRKMQESIDNKMLMNEREILMFIKELFPDADLSKIPGYGGPQGVD